MAIQRAPRGTPTVCNAALALAIAAALAPIAHADAGTPAQRPGAAALHGELRALMPQAPIGPSAPATVLPVTSCADGDAATTLRGAVAAAGEGDIVDLGQLHCSLITLSQGAIPVLLNDLTIVGPGADALRIDGAGVDRVFVHPGGGALTVQGLTIRNGAKRVAGNKITGGGCIASNGYVVLDHSVVSDCYASAEGVYGGGIFAYGLNMYTSTLSRNVGFAALEGSGTATFGGGAYVALMTLVESTLRDNRASHDLAQGGYDTGGAVFSDYGGSIESSTIEGNYSRGLGGGVSTFSGALNVVNSTISDNIARTGTGGGMDLRLSGVGRISNSTIAGNQAAGGGGVYLRGQPRSFYLQSSLVAGNAADHGGADFGASGSVTISGANNLVVAAGANAALPPDTLHAAPLLQPLADNGGPTRTRALSPGSPALDAGNNVAGLAYDQRGPGFPRSIGAGVDIGAFEGVRVPARQPANVPAAGPAGLMAGAAAVLLSGLLAIGRRQAASRAFTLLSPRSGHSSHT